MPQLDRSRDSTTKLIISSVVDGDYYGGSSAAVPFKWESQPGTPRRLFKRSSSRGYDSDSDCNSPVSAPLTPPPSYYPASPCTKPTINPKKSNKLFGSLLSKNRSVLSSSSSSSSTTSTTSSPLRTPDGKSGLKHYSAKSSGCYASIIKVMLLRDVK